MYNAYRKNKMINRRKLEKSNLKEEKDPKNH